MWNTHKIMGITEDTSGREFIDIAATQLEEYGTHCYTDRVTTITATEEHNRQF